MAAMNTMMPLIMVFIFYNMPSGLVLYWLVNTMMQGYQSWRIHKTAPSHGGAEDNMSDKIEIQGKTVDEAVSEALLQMGARRDEVEITVLEEPKSGFLGILGSRQARVLVRKRRRGEAVAGLPPERRRPRAALPGRRGVAEAAAARGGAGAAAARRYERRRRTGGSVGRRRTAGADVAAGGRSARARDRGSRPAPDETHRERVTAEAAVASPGRGRGGSATRRGRAAAEAGGRAGTGASSSRGPKPDAGPEIARTAPRDDDADGGSPTSRRGAGGAKPGRRGIAPRRGRRGWRGSRTERQRATAQTPERTPSAERAESVNDQPPRDGREAWTERPRSRGVTPDRAARSPAGVDAPEPQRPGRPRDGPSWTQPPRRSGRRHASPRAEEITDMAESSPRLEGRRRTPPPVRDVRGRRMTMLKKLATGMLVRAGFPCRCEVKPGEYSQVKIVTDDSQRRHAHRPPRRDRRRGGAPGRTHGRHGGRRPVRMNLDINNYRRRREEICTSDVPRPSAEVQETGRPSTWSPCTRASGASSTWRGERGRCDDLHHDGLGRQARGGRPG